MLRVLRKRKDGYHELCTLFHRISLRDTLHLRKKSEGIRLICAHPRVPQRGNLITRAFHLLKAKYPFPGGVTVRLIKRIPVGGGLGGGSSDAAHFLMGMNRLFRLGLNSKELLKLGGKLGADVAFFLSGARHAMGLGKGEQIRAIPFRRRLGFLLVMDRRGLATRQVYQRLQLPNGVLSLTRASHDVRMASAFLEKGKLNRVAQFFTNDLTASAERLRPSLRKTRESLSGLHLGTCHMSGSGPTLFFVFPSYEEACQALRQLKNRRFPKSFLVCHTF